MKLIRKVLYFSGLACLVLTGCAKSPTKPDEFSTLKKNAADLAATLQNEVAAFRGKSFLRNVKMAVYTRSQYASMVSGQTTGIPCLPAWHLQQDIPVRRAAAREPGLLRGL